jgi:plasmid stabilization system protein ParE
MMDYVIRLTSRAEGESDKIFTYIHKRSPSGAIRWHAAMIDSLALLRGNPAGRPRAPEGMQFDVEVRQLLFKTRKGLTYRALFIVNEEDRIVHVLSIRGPSQDLLSAEEIETALDFE